MKVILERDRFVSIIGNQHPLTAPLNVPVHFMPATGKERERKDQATASVVMVHAPSSGHPHRLSRTIKP